MFAKIKKLIVSPDFKRLIKFGVTGVANTLIDLLVFTVLRSGLSVNLYLSKTAGYLAGMINSYTINRKWTFKTKSDFLSMEFLKFVLLNAAMLGVSYGLLYLFTTFFAIPDFIANLVATCIVMLISFLVSNFWVFKNKQN